MNSFQRPAAVNESHRGYLWIEYDCRIDYLLRAISKKKFKKMAVLKVFLRNHQLISKTNFIPLD